MDTPKFTSTSCILIDDGLPNVRWQCKANPCPVHGGAYPRPVAPRPSSGEPRLDLQARGCRIVAGSLARARRKILYRCAILAESFGASEIVLPSVEPAQVYVGKAGPEVLGQMYVFPDRKDRVLCLRPEGTATCQLLAAGPWAHERDLKLWYEARCWRYERPQEGRYREFTQFGVEVLNPTRDYVEELTFLAEKMVSITTQNFEVKRSVKRGLAYYTEEGFEISCEELGAQKQVCGGGKYAEGVGFALGIDRLMLMAEKVG